MNDNLPAGWTWARDRNNKPTQHAITDGVQHISRARSGEQTKYTLWVLRQPIGTYATLVEALENAKK